MEELWRERVLVGFDSAGRRLWAPRPRVSEDGERLVFERPSTTRDPRPERTHPEASMTDTGNGWLCAACGALGMDRRLLEEVGCEERRPVR